MNGSFRLCGPKPSKTPNVLSWGFVTSKPLIARAQIARDKNHRFGYENIRCLTIGLNNKMIRKMAILARDRPLFFFVVGFLFLFLLTTLATTILAIIWNFSAIQPSGAWEILLVMAVFLPVLVIFFPICFMFAEWYFNLLRMGRIVGLKKKPFLMWFLRWAGVEQREQET